MSLVCSAQFADGSKCSLLRFQPSKSVRDREREREIPKGHLWLLLLALLSGEMWNDETVFIADKQACLACCYPFLLHLFTLIYAMYCQIASAGTQNYACVCRVRWHLEFHFTLKFVRQTYKEKNQQSVWIYLFCGVTYCFLLIKSAKTLIEIIRVIPKTNKIQWETFFFYTIVGQICHLFPCKTSHSHFANIRIWNHNVYENYMNFCLHTNLCICQPGYWSFSTNVTGLNYI